MQGDSEQIKYQKKNMLLNNALLVANQVQKIDILNDFFG
jgi:hypothetical protein